MIFNSPYPNINPFLTNHNDDVLDSEIPELVSLLEKELELSNKSGIPGIGLAAPQIGINKKIAIIRLGKNSSYNYDIDLINPRIVNAYDLTIFQNEGCLSFPGITFNTSRYQEVEITSNNKNYVATGLLSIAFQHEIDHLNGVLFFERKLKPVINTSKVGPNDPCPCGEIDQNTLKIKKYKKCHGK
jgi:peptide deformylase